MRILHTLETQCVFSSIHECRDADVGGEFEDDRVRGEVVIIKCVFCLSDMEEGEEIREVRCGHVFHKGCLDKWYFKYRRSRCPLCRRYLQVSTEMTEEEFDEGVEDDEGEDSGPLLLAFVQSEWLGRCMHSLFWSLKFAVLVACPSFFHVFN